MNAPTTADATQVAGTHYKTLAIQPWNYTAANGLNWFEGEVIKYVTRWQSKGGVNDLRKARHIIDKMVELSVNHGWPAEHITVEQLAQLLGFEIENPWAALRAVCPAEVDDNLLAALRNRDADGPTRRLPETDESALERAVVATDQITAALETCNGLLQGVTGKPFPLHTALRTTLTHTESSLVTALRDLNTFRGIVKEHSAHE